MNIEEVIRYKCDDGFEFSSEQEARDHLLKRVDKNGQFVKIGDTIKESWNFHGLGIGSLEGQIKINDYSYMNEKKNFRFVKFESGVKLDINRVNNQGWEVSGYEFEIVEPNEEDKFRNNPDFAYSGDRKYSKPPFHYREKRESDK